MALVRSIGWLKTLALLMALVLSISILAVGGTVWTPDIAAAEDEDDDHDDDRDDDDHDDDRDDDDHDDDRDDDDHDDRDDDDHDDRDDDDRNDDDHDDRTTVHADIRLYGADRYATSAAVSRRAFPSGANVVYLARSDDAADALSGGALSDGPVLVVPRCGELPDAIEREIARLAPSNVLVLGGPAAVCDDIIDDALDD